MRVSVNERRLRKLLRKYGDRAHVPVDLIAECLAEGLDVERIIQAYEATASERL